jgi:hypothetical protein
MIPDRNTYPENCFKGDISIKYYCFQNRMSVQFQSNYTNYLPEQASYFKWLTFISYDNFGANNKIQRKEGTCWTIAGR